MKHLYCIVPAVVFLNACGPSTPPPMYQAPAIVQQTPAPVIIQQDSGLGSALLGAAAGAAVTAAVSAAMRPRMPEGTGLSNMERPAIRFIVLKW